MLFVWQERLKALTDIVWPEIALLAKNRISKAREEGMNLNNPSNIDVYRMMENYIV